MLGGYTQFSKNGEIEQIVIKAPPKHKLAHEVATGILLHEDGHILFGSFNVGEAVLTELKKLLPDTSENILRDLINIFEDHRVEFLLSQRIARNLALLLPLRALVILMQSLPADDDKRGNIVQAVLLLARAAYAPSPVSARLREIAEKFLAKARMKNQLKTLSNKTMQLFLNYSRSAISEGHAAKLIKDLTDLFPELLDDAQAQPSATAIPTPSDEILSAAETLTKELQIKAKSYTTSNSSSSGMTWILNTQDRSWERIHTQIFGQRPTQTYRRYGIDIEPLSITRPTPLFTKKIHVRAENGKRYVALLIDFSGSTEHKRKGRTIYQLELAAANSITQEIESKGGKVAWIHFSEESFVLKHYCQPIPKRLEVQFSGTQLQPALGTALSLKPIPETIVVLTDALLLPSDYELLNQLPKNGINIYLFNFSSKSVANNINLFDTPTPKALARALAKLHRDGGL